MMRRRQTSIYDLVRKTIRAYRKDSQSFTILTDEQVAAIFRQDEPENIPSTWITIKNSWLYKEEDSYIVAGYKHPTRNRQYFDMEEVLVQGFIIGSTSKDTYVKVGKNKWVQIDNRLSAF